MEILIVILKVLAVLVILAVVLIGYTLKKMLDATRHCEICNDGVKKPLDKRK